MIIKDGKILLGKRKGKHGAGAYALPGGHFEYMEKFEDSAKREIAEETGIEISDIEFLCVDNIRDYAPKHYVDIGFTAKWKSGEVVNKEPDVCEGWDWYDMDTLPSPLFPSVEHFIEAYKGGKRFFDK